MYKEEQIVRVVELNENGEKLTKLLHKIKKNGYFDLTGVNYLTNVEKYKDIWKSILQTTLLEDGSDADSQYELLSQKAAEFYRDRPVTKKNIFEIDLKKFMALQESVEKSTGVYEKFDTVNCREYFAVDFLLYSKTLK
jgi:hypothetical protein